MKKSSILPTLSLIVCAGIALAMSAPTLAQHAGGYVRGAVGHVGFGGYRGGYGGYYGGYGRRGGYGWGVGYGSYRPWGWGGYGYYDPWVWGGVGLGYFSTLPLYYSTVWWDGVPYYYAGNTYYVWNDTVNQYETVRPSPGLRSQGAAQSPGASELIAYPKNGQSEEQQGKDKFECHRWAVAQTGFDPTRAAGGTAPGKRSDYYRAQGACLDGRGYSVK
jgi:hypothetical protein